MIIDDGYIKYSANHQQVDNFDFKTDVSELLKTRDYLHKLGLIGVYPNGIGFGNASIRCDYDFIITGSATGNIEHLQKEHLCLVKRIDIVDNKVWSKGSVQASSESMTHGAIYIINRKVNCVLHIHSRSIFDRLKQLPRDNDKIHFTSERFKYGTPDIAYAIIDEVKKIGKKGKSCGTIVMLGHDEGIISFGDTVSSALAEIESLVKMPD